jgi:hypothetical protein
MSPTSYQAAPPRVIYILILIELEQKCQGNKKTTYQT